MVNFFFQFSQYGNPASMPSWWPNHVMDWMKIKNLGQSYKGIARSLRIALFSGYKHYGLNANNYIRKQKGPCPVVVPDDESAPDQSRSGKDEIDFRDFLFGMLNDENQSFTSFIDWTNVQERVFQIYDGPGLARLWGIKKYGRPLKHHSITDFIRKNYEKLALRRDPEGIKQRYQ
jgi:hypothetical protein